MPYHNHIESLKEHVLLQKTKNRDQAEEFKRIIETRTKKYEAIKKSYEIRNPLYQRSQEVNRQRKKLSIQINIIKNDIENRKKLLNALGKHGRDRFYRLIVSFVLSVNNAQKNRNITLELPKILQKKVELVRTYQLKCSQNGLLFLCYAILLYYNLYDKTI